ncbi:MAG: UDP-N-acetylmuramoyl-L-alanine--D-glutamate ligase [Prolixibacteraceae bacterium]|nr:UDP-N-acetylmuramoyl-L-alanine--D-glutamate ligase [Prolixibacteraceae bacterium]MBN2648887.1 UDP-N-acetylmuramoyl-L-alanine--D-glutamate ligase [Prolixibacteraceae bacterium]
MSERLVILGAGESGVGTAILAQAKGFDVFVSDGGIIKEKYRNELQELGISFEEGKHTNALVLNASQVVKSPGIPDNVPVVVEIKKQNIPIISEIEFAGRYTSAKLICITGSNGKTTTTSLIYDMLKRAGFNVGLGGNIGLSFARQVATGHYTHYVLELSSFQLDGMFHFKADVAVLMNITPDHLDRYNNDMQQYIDSKFRIVQNQTTDDVFVFFADDEVIAREMKKREATQMLAPFSFSGILTKNGAFVDNDTMKVIYNKNEFEMTIYDLALQGKHNLCNSMAAAIVGKVADIKNEYIRECLTGFVGVEHRLEKFISVHGIEFINDSKATNINSTWYALESMTRPTVWIVGGVDKGNDYSELADLVREKVRAIVCLGKDNSKIVAAFSGVVPEIVETQSMEHAVKSAYFLAEKGDNVLLSPACASFDLFNNYKERGKMFKEEVRNL